MSRENTHTGLALLIIAKQLLTSHACIVKSENPDVIFTSRSLVTWKLLTRLQSS